jgi:hypothetical protein
MKSWRLRSSEHYISINVIIVPAADSVAKLVHFEMNWDPTITGLVLVYYLISCQHSLIFILKRSNKLRGGGSVPDPDPT